MIGTVNRTHPLYGIDGVEKLPAPKALSGKDVKDFGAVIKCFGEYLTRCLRDKNWSLRKAAVEKMCAKLRGADGPPNGQLVPALKAVMKVMLSESVIHVFVKAVELANVLLDKGL